MNPQTGSGSAVTATETTHEYVLKTTNDRRVLDALADEVGFEWFVRGTKLTFRPRPALGTPAISLSWNGTPPLLRLGVRASGIDGASASSHECGRVGACPRTGKTGANAGRSGMVHPVSDIG